MWKPLGQAVDQHQLSGLQGNQIRLDKERQTFQSSYAAVLPETASQADAYRAVENVVTDALQGYNATVIAYGSTGTGKTHTMLGPHGLASNPGMRPSLPSMP